MDFYFLPEELQIALKCININFLSEIRIRNGQAVIIEYKDEYTYINKFGCTDNKTTAIVVCDAAKILINATKGSIYAYTEQLKKGFITIGGGIRIGVCGEYVCEGERVSTIKSVTSLNIRIPHDVNGCSAKIYDLLFFNNVANTLIISPPGYGKTTILRDLVKRISDNYKYNILVFDERNEISAYDGSKFSYDLGDKVDVVRCGGKFQSFENAIRTMKPQVIVTDELYGEEDIAAVRFALCCGLNVIAYYHITKRELLTKLPFDYFVELTGIGKRVIVYDKNFVVINDNSSDHRTGLPDVYR